MDMRMPKDLVSVDAEIQKYRAAIKGLQRHRNSLIPIATIPDELLGEIFIYNLLATGTSDFSYEAELRSPRCWTNVTCVCHRWRDVALSTPRLWSFVGTLDPRWYRVFIPRSKAVQLSIRLTGTQYVSRLPILNPDVRDRIRELHISARVGVVDSLLEPFDESPPHLPLRIPSLPLSITSLRLYNTDTRDNRSVIKLPKAFDPGQLPHLTQLELVRCEVDWSSPILTSTALTHLTIRGLFPSTPLPRIISILQSQPHLVHLNLDLGRSKTDSSTATTTEIDLPLLRYLELSHHPCIDLTGYLRKIRACDNVHLSFKSKTYPSWRLGPSGEPSTLDSYVLPFFSRFYGKVTDSTIDFEPPVITRLTLVFTPHGRYHVELLHEQKSGSIGSCRINISWPRPSELDFLTQPICEHLPLSHLRSLHLDNVHLTSIGWRETFVVTTKIDEIVITGNGVALRVIQAMMPASIGPQDLEDQIPQVLLPQLRRLEIAFVDFVTLGRAIVKESLVDLQTCLKARKERQCGLQILVFHQCLRLSEADVGSYVSAGVAAKVDYEVLNDRIGEEDSVDDIARGQWQVT